MNIIRDEECFGLMMIPLLIEWGIRRCNVDECTARPNTIVIGLVDDIAVGFCEDHYQAAKKPGGMRFDLVFDDFDAFETESDGEE